MKCPIFLFLVQSVAKYLTLQQVKHFYYCKMYYSLEYTYLRNLDSHFSLLLSNSANMERKNTKLSLTSQETSLFSFILPVAKL